jgi:hypothetical protein
MADARPPLPRLPGGPDPDAPIPRDPVGGIDVRTVGLIAGSLAAAPDASAATFARFGLDAGRFRAIEATWMVRLAAEALAGEGSLRADYDAGFAEATASSEAKELSLDAYAASLAAITAGEPVAKVVADAGLTLASWMRNHQRWTARAAADGAVAAELARLAGARRSALG